MMGKMMGVTPLDKKNARTGSFRTSEIPPQTTQNIGMNPSTYLVEFARSRRPQYALRVQEQNHTQLVRIEPLWHTQLKSCAHCLCVGVFDLEWSQWGGDGPATAGGVFYSGRTPTSLFQGWNPHQVVNRILVPNYSTRMPTANDPLTGSLYR